MEKRGGPEKMKLTPGAKIEIRPLPAEGRTLKKVGKFLVSVSTKAQSDAAADVRAERDGR